MALTPRLEQRQGQALVMTPQLQQAIKLLQLSNMELISVVEQELQENPILEREEIARDESIDDPLDSHPDDLTAEGDPPPENLNEIDFDQPAEAIIDRDMGFDTDYDNLYSHKDYERPNSQSPSDSDWNHSSFSETNHNINASNLRAHENSLEETIGNTVSLRQHLMEQLALEFSKSDDRLIGLHLIDHLDKAGYLSKDYESLTGTLGCDDEVLEKVLTRLQTFDPTGIFARNVGECLALQLREKDRLDPCMTIFLKNIDMLAKRDLKGLAAICDCDDEDVADMISEIRLLNPRPAAGFEIDVAQPITPDVLMHSAPNGKWIIELNTQSLPRVLVNNQYYAEIRKKAQSDKDKQYISEQYQSANWLVKALHQRATTILKVATELIKQQEKFFTHGIQFLKPLVLRDIADEIEMHESTVSRVTSNKFIATPRGIFELKYFFTPAIGSTKGGEPHSAEAVRHRIKNLIDDEKTGKILSDDKLVALLRADGVDIARRTVAKYRESLRIPSSVQRRRDRAL
ncbi:MAG: RNA polymerase sigma-54 factor [Rhodospirillaceae bacterium TMED8]|nr:RNA polymerase sigma-54 factor [Magnetovibrio sp.]OUT53345.1 MAG: RNA polymerase sigma-54 factor [Rhodospirillaceae bacterium TMED8]|tara:strand:+ start:2490 stop:4040 length:1551 start_codon:yes stop_codon:yes gene_type:complete